MIKTRKCNVVDDYHGTKVPDPYRWLEDPESEETKLWSRKQNELSYEYFQNIETRKDYKEKLSRLWYYTEFHVPKKINDGLLFMEKDSMDNQPKLYFKKDDNAESKVVIDPNTFSEDGTVALSNYSMSSNGRYLAYAKSSSGSDWQNIRVLDMDTGKDLEKEIKWCRFTNIVWNPENTGFYYGRFPNPETVSKEEQGNYNHICFHKIGTNQSEDRLIYEDKGDKELSFYPSITEDDRYLVLHVGRGTSPKNGFYYKDLRDDSEFAKLLNEGESEYNFIGNKESLFYFKTDNRASKGRIIGIDIKSPEPSNWVELIPETEDIIDRVDIIGNKLVVVYMHDVKHKIKVFNMNGKFQYDINLPIIGTITEITGKEEDSEMYFGLMSFTQPTSIYKFNVDTRELQLINKTDIDFEGSQYETKQIFYKSKDGTKVPMFIIHKKGIKLDSNNHTMLFGYGGFNLSLTPSFHPGILAWLENDGVYAVANLRGG